MQSNPISFTCHATLPISGEAIAAQILDLEKWRDFKGSGPIPGIKSAEFEIRTPEVLGTRIRVVNLDGSSHVEEIVEWRPKERLQLRMAGFSPPLSGMADFFIETWDFAEDGNQTKVKRSMELHPKSIRARMVLWMISFLLKGAIAKHLRVIQKACI